MNILPTKIADTYNDDNVITVILPHIKVSTTKPSSVFTTFFNLSIMGFNIFKSFKIPPIQ